MNRIIFILISLGAFAAVFKLAAVKRWKSEKTWNVILAVAIVSIAIAAWIFPE